MKTKPDNQKFRWVLILMLLFIPLQADAQPEKMFRIGTGGRSGVYYPVGKLIAEGLTRDAGSKKGLENHIAVAQHSAGSIDNVQSIINGEIEAALVQADVAYLAYHSERFFKGKKQFRKLRAVASLYPEKLQIVVRKDASINGIPDLKRQRISLDEQGSGTLAVMRIVLEAHDMMEADLDPVYLKPVYTHEKFIAGDLQGFTMMGGIPLDAVLELKNIELAIVPVEKEMAGQIHQKYQYLVPGKIPADTYPGIPETPTIEVNALLLVHSDLDEDLVFQMTSLLWEKNTQKLLREGHPQGKAINLETALKGVSIPLHKGAKRYYLNQGMMEQER